MGKDFEAFYDDPKGPKPCKSQKRDCSRDDNTLPSYSRFRDFPTLEAFSETFLQSKQQSSI